MSLRIFSLPSSRTTASTAQSACRFNSTSSESGLSALQNILRPSTPSPASTRSAPGRRPIGPTAVDREKLRQGQRAQADNRALEKFQTRDWKAGDIYAPHDLSPAEMKKWRKRSAPTSDAFDALNLNPIHLYKNFTIMSEYMTEMGRIKHRKMTGLRGVNQRKVAKAIRRAIGIGLMPSVHRHPEILAEFKQRSESVGL
ncbi:mitochondrial 37S ribosomal protein bS18m [Aspergillus undulatus]|uniref:mitochondrial 37S ribosomal protein bS18m n=1 Tax=Aspergillus undulatus TaxID=1810928 RepID=UPI003CCDB91E